LLYETTNAKLRQHISERLKKEFTRSGLPDSDPTQIAIEFNALSPTAKIAAQTDRTWLLADAIPTKAQLIGRANWLGVSPQGLRFDTGRARRRSRVNRHTMRLTLIRA
jgi:hypothetical protein